MTRLITFFLLLVSVMAFGQTSKAVFVIVDGIPADVIEKLELPTLFEIRKKGGYTRALQGGEKGGYSQSPTISAVGYNNVLTGTWTNKHNVWDNDIKYPNYNYWTIFRIAKQTKPELKTAIFSTWLDNRTKLVGEGLPQTGAVKLDYVFDGYELDTTRFPHDKGAQYISKIDELVSTEAANTIRNHAPDLSWVYLEFTDDMGHRFGDSPQFYEAIKKADSQVGKIWDAIKEREAKHNEQWMIVITTDHGRDAATGKSHGGQSDRERTGWIVTNVADRNARFGNEESPAKVVDILPSITRFMGIEIPPAVREELDGVPFVGTVALADLKAEEKGGKIALTWKPLGVGEAAEVFITTSNHFKTGGKDIYQKVAEVNSGTGHFSLDLFGIKEPVFKVLLKTKSNWVNTWVAR